MNRKNAAIMTMATGVLLMALVIGLVATLGGCGGGASPAVIAAIGAGSQQQNPDNPIFPVPPSHPNRIVFRSNRDENGSYMIWASDLYGGSPTIVAKTKDETETPVPSTREFTYQYPAVSQDGFTVYMSCDYFATSTNIISTGITNTAQVNVVEQGVDLIDPRVSWDGTKIAFVGYTSESITAVKKPEEMVVTEAELEAKKSSQIDSIDDISLLYLWSGAWKISTNVTTVAAPTSYGLLMLDETNVTQCPVPCTLKDAGTPMADGDDYCDADKATMNYANEIKFTTEKRRYNFGDNYPLGQTICLNMDGKNFLIMEVTEYSYGYTKMPGYVCSEARDEKCGVDPFTVTDDFAGTEFICQSQGLCVNDDGTISTQICTTDADCDNTCDTELRCMMDSGEEAYITLDWTWVEQTITDKGTTMSGSPVIKVGDADPITISDSFLETGEREGTGINLIQTLDFNTYDLYTSDIDGTNIVKHSSDDIAQRYPCFSPSSPDVVYFTQAEASSAYLDPDDPIVSEIYKLIISTGETEKVFENTQLVRHCAFNPSGTQFAFSQYNGTDYDLYIYDMSEGTATFLLDTGGDDLYPTFSPDGSMIAFQSDESYDNDIYTTDLTGTNIMNISNNRDKDDVTPVWTP